MSSELRYAYDITLFLKKIAVFEKLSLENLKLHVQKGELREITGSKCK